MKPFTSDALNNMTPEARQEILTRKANENGMSDPSLLEALLHTENGQQGHEFGYGVMRSDPTNPKSPLQVDPTRPDWMGFENQAGAAAFQIKKEEQDYLKDTGQQPLQGGKYTPEFLKYFSSGGKSYPGYAPVGVENDPKGLNQNHYPNLLANYSKLNQLPPKTSEQVGSTLELQTSERELLQAEKDNGSPVEEPIEQVNGFWDMLLYPGDRSRSELARLMGRMGLSRSGLGESDLPDRMAPDEFLKVVFDYEAPEGQGLFNPDPKEPILLEAVKYLSKIPGSMLKFQNYVAAEFGAGMVDPLSLIGTGAIAKTRSWLAGKVFEKEVLKAQKVVDKLNAQKSGTDLQGVADKYAEDVARLTGKPSPQLAQRATELLENDPHFLDKVKYLHPNTTMNDEELMAGAILMADKADDILHFVNTIGPQGMGAVGAKKALTDMLGDLAGLAAPQKGARSAVGRSLQSIQQQDKTAKKMFVDQFTKLFEKGLITPESAAAQISKFKSQADLAILARQMSTPGWHQMYNELLVNGLLSGPVTYMGLNPIGNSLAFLGELGSRQVAGLFGKGGVPVGEASRMGMAALSTVPAAVGMWWRTMRSGQHALNEMVTNMDVKIDLNQFAAITSENFPNAPNWIRPGIDWFGAITRTPSRMMMSQDEFFKSIFYQAEITAQAGRLAMETPGWSKMTRAQKAARRSDLLSDIATNPHKYRQLDQRAKQFAHDNTFTSTLGPTGEAMVDLTNSNSFIKMIFPFVRTPVNVMKRIGKDLPFGLGAPHKLVSALKSADKATRDEALGRLGFSSLMATTMLNMTLNGVVVGGRGPRERGLQKVQRELQGRVQGSVAFDTDGDGQADQFLQLNTRTPLGQVLNLVGSMGEGYGFIQERDPEMWNKMADEMVLAMGDLLEEAPFMDGLGNFFEMMRRYEQEGLAGVEDHIKTTAPTYLFPSFSGARRQLARAADPTKRTPNNLDMLEGIMDGLAMQLPGWSEGVQPVHDMFGNEEQYPVGYGPEMVQNNAFGRMAMLFVPGLNMMKETEPVPPAQMEIAQFMIDREIIPPPPPKKYMGIEIPHNLYEQLKVVAGTGVLDHGDGTGTRLLGQSMQDRLMEVVKEPDDTLVLKQDGTVTTQDSVTFKEEYNQQYQEALELLLLTDEWASIRDTADQLEINNPELERSTNRLQRRTTGIRLLQ